MQKTAFQIRANSSVHVRDTPRANVKTRECTSSCGLSLQSICTSRTGWQKGWLMHGRQAASVSPKTHILFLEQESERVDNIIFISTRGMQSRTFCSRVLWIVSMRHWNAPPPRGRYWPVYLGDTCRGDSMQRLAAFTASHGFHAWADASWLLRSPAGYFLFMTGGPIDWASLPTRRRRRSLRWLLALCLTKN